MPPHSRRFALRDATSASHIRLEELVGSLTSLQAYKRYVRGMYAFRTPVEAKVASAKSPIGGDNWGTSFVAQDLKEDLSDLQEPLPKLISIQDMSFDIDGMLGILYVLEGSSLGAKLLTGQARALGLTGQFGARHLERQTASSQNWQKYIALLEASTNVNTTAIAHSANITFSIAFQAMAQGLDHDEY